jgi:Tfp pilus assembly protein PilO
MKLDIDAILAKLTPLTLFWRRYRVVICIVLVVLTYSMIVYQINVLTRAEPTEAQVTDKLKTVQRPKIDARALSKIQQLQDQNVDVKSLFKQTRENPFSE